MKPSKQDIDDIYPLSPMQEGLLFQALYDAESAAYFLQMTLELTGALNAAYFRQAWRILAQRHAVLRSAFVHEGVKQPLQVVLKQREPALHTADLSPLSPAQQEEQLAHYAQQDRARGFDLQKEPLMRFALFQLDAASTHHALIWSYHHILLDGWCLGTLQSEFTAVYRALATGHTPHLPPITPYKNYIRWLAQQDQSRALQYWRDYLSGYDHLASIPTTPHADPAAPSAPQQHPTQLTKAHTAALQTFCQQHSLTLNTLLQTAWGILLARYNNQRDVVFGAIVSGRPAALPGIEQMVGLFINAIPVRVRFDGRETAADLLQRQQQHALASEPFHYLPLAEIQAAQGEGDLFDHMLIFESYPLDTAESDEPTDPNPLTMHGRAVHDRTHYNLDLTILPGPQLAFSLNYNAAAYSAGQMARLAAQLLHLLQAIIQNPHQPLAQLPILPAAEVQTLLHTFAGPRRPYPLEQTIPALFAAQAQATPQRIAITQADGQSLTYEALNGRANALAAQLRQRGATRGHFVPLLAPRGCAFLVGLMGILKAGAAYVPIDPDYPAERVAYMLADCGAKIIVSHTAVSSAPANALWIDGLALDENTPNPPAINTAEDPAYMLYTSGSTGQPKGALIRHNGAINHIFAEIELLNLADNFTFLQSAPASSDISVWQFIAPILRGGRVVVADLPTVADPAALWALLQRERITLFELVPTVLQALLDHAAELPKRDLPHLTVAMVTGEAVPVALINQWVAMYPHLPLVNAYGPTEAADDITQIAITAPLPPHTAVPIGHTLPNLRVLVLDAALRLQPLGAHGEICVAGVGVGAGYWQQPEKTAAAFVPNPHAQNKYEQTLYRTGDIGFWDDAGLLHFIGRADEQVNIHGRRLELGEIESQLLAFAAVRQTAVVVQNEQLIAYFVGDGGQVDDLQAHLTAVLPHHMRPAHLIPLAALPLTPAGKVDKRALRQRELAARSGAKIPPRTETEKKIAAVWGDILQIETIGIHDNFFGLGGHSLKAMQVLSRLQKSLQVRLSVRDLFDQPTIAGLASLVDGGAPSQAFAPIPIAPAQAHYPLSHAQKRLWLEHQLDKTAAYNMPEAYELRQAFDFAALDRAFATLIERHEALRTAFILVDGEPRQEIWPVSAVPFAITHRDLTAEANPSATARKLADEEAARPFDLTAPPLFRATFLKLGEAHTIFLLTVHHIVGDGWSGRVLYEELLTLYEAYRHGRPNPLPPLRLQYKDFALWQLQRGFAQEEAFWLSALAGVPDYVRLPYDIAPQAERAFAGQTAVAELDAETTAGLRQLAQTHNTTLSNVVLSLYQLLLFQLTKQRDICVGTAVANRQRPEVENLLGFFVNILPVRVQFEADMEFEALLTAVVGWMNDALAHQDYPFDLLIQKLNPRRTVNRMPIINVMYGFQNYADVQLDLGTNEAAAEVSQIGAFDFSFETSKFDLTLFVLDSGATIDLSLEYDSRLFKPASIQRYLGALVRFAKMVASS